MTGELDETGPIDYLVVEFPGNRMTGEGLPLLVGLVDRGIIRILDLVFVRKELDGSVTGMALADLNGDGTLDLAVFEGASSGLLDAGDVQDSAAVLEAGSSAGILVYDNVWAVPFATAPAPRRCPDRGHRPDPGPGGAGRARRARPGRRLIDLPPTTARAGGHRAGSTSRDCAHRGHRGHRHSRVQPRLAPAGRALGATGRSTGRRRAAPVRAGPPPPSPVETPPDEMSVRLQQLRELGDLKSQGVLTEAEFQAQKQRLLG